MSAMDIIKELPRLTEAERRAIRQVLLEIANQDATSLPAISPHWKAR